MHYNYRHQRWKTYVSKYLSKLSLTLIPILLPYSASTHALSTATSKVINGSAPYLTPDNGVTKFSTIYDLMSITISDDTTKITYTPADSVNNSKNNPFVLLKENQSFADIGMIFPVDTNSIALKDLIRAPYNYWGDDDGDGLGPDGISAEGSIKLVIKNRYHKEVSRSEVLNICDAPYSIEINSTDSSLTTKYGVPNSTNFASGRSTYYVSPKAGPTVCYAKPFSMHRTEGNETWNYYNGFYTQSTEPSGYSRNFPTTGSNNMQFYLLISGLDSKTAAKLSWPVVKQGGMTATVSTDASMLDYSYSVENDAIVRVTLTGPKPKDSQKYSDTPYRLESPSLPQTFEIIGYGQGHKETVKYGFVLKRWFVSRGDISSTHSEAVTWCASLGDYRLPPIKDFTNALPYPAFVSDIRQIGSGFLSEWGNPNIYPNSDFSNREYWTTDLHPLELHPTSPKTKYYEVEHIFATIISANADEKMGDVVCAFP